MPPLKVVFMGTPTPAVAVLEALIEAGHDVVAVYTRAPRRVGRGQRERRSPVHERAAERGLGVRTPPGFRNDGEREAFAALDADVAVVAAYGRILPPAVLEAPRRGCINVHASLLPRWRGAAPVQRAIAAGDRETGVTVMQMDEGLDTGPILLAAPVGIAPGDRAPALLERLFRLGAELVLRVLESETVEARPQPEEGVTHAPRLERGEGRIDWSEDAAAIERKIRAFDPWPGAWCERGGERLRILDARAVPGSGPPGTVVGEPLRVACGAGVLIVDRVQRAGRSAVTAEAYLRGSRLAPGTALT